MNYLASSAALGQVWHHTGYYPPPPHGQLTQEAASSKQSGLINSEVHHPVCPVSIMPVRLYDAGLDPVPGASHEGRCRRVRTQFIGFIPPGLPSAQQTKRG